MKISESDFRRLHWKSRKLDEVCRILFDGYATVNSPQSVVREVSNVVGEYRPGPLRTVDRFLDDENRYADDKASR